MGQQQLLLLVLSTVIVGLATVAGIQAFDEGQSQATQDALVQRALEIGNDVYAAHEKPSQFGGIEVGTDKVADIAAAAGYDTATDISADGAGDSAQCDITSNGGTITCSSNGTDSNASGNEYVAVSVDPTAGNPVSVLTINSQDVGS